MYPDFSLARVTKGLESLIELLIITVQMKQTLSKNNCATLFLNKMMSSAFSFKNDSEIVLYVGV